MGKQTRESGINIIGNLPWGSHFCLFYQTKQDLVDILVPYFKAGLENNEFCLWITSSPLNVKEVKKVMKKAVADFDQYLKKGQIEIIPHAKWYLKDGVFNLQRVLKAWVDKINQALYKSYDGIRITGNTAWLKKRNWRNFADYEERVNKTIGKYRMIALCTYPLDQCGAVEVIDVVSNHRSALIRRNEKWELIESSKYKQAKEVLEQKVKEATRQLKRQHQAQQNLFIDLAHELKTPLTVMGGSLDLALGKAGEKIRKDPKSFARFLVSQKEEVERIEKIINNLSTLAKAETNQLPLRLEKIRLDKLLSQICFRWQTVAQQEKKKLKLKKLRPLTIVGDREQLEQLVDNLLDNAVKFTRPKSDQIQVFLTQDRGRAKIRIVDNGIGIPQKDLPYIFERFSQSNNLKGHPKLKGSGLGLAICQWIVKKHGGKIKIKSQKGVGTEVSVSLPPKFLTEN